MTRRRTALAAPSASPPAATAPEEAPVALLDAKMRVVAVSASFEELVGLSGDAIIDQPLARLCARPGGAEALEKTLRDALAGQISSARIPVRRTASPRDLVLAVDFRAVRLAQSHGVMLTVSDWLRDDSCGTPRLGDITYSISLRRFGILQWVHFANNDHDGAEYVGKGCHQVLFERETPCEGCPLRQTPNGRLAGVVRGGSSDGTRPYIVVASRPNSSTALVSATAIDGAMLQRIIGVQLDRRARQAGLTVREREVLDLVMLGRSASEIAAALRIAASTAKFHQANALRKLGVESRADLYRSLLRAP